jgi:hypothetical protein
MRTPQTAARGANRTPALCLPRPAGVAASDALRSTLPCPSANYWLAAASMAPITLAVLAGVRHQLLSKHEGQQQACQGARSCQGGSPSSLSESESEKQPSPGCAGAADAGEVVWTAESTVVYPALCTFVGVIAGMFGVGGGIIKVGVSHRPQTLYLSRKPLSLYQSLWLSGSPVA